MLTKLEATSKVKRFMVGATDIETAEKLGISRPTLYKRLTKMDWKKGELSLIEKW